MANENETTPLVEQQDYYDEDGNSIYSEHTLHNKKILKYSLIAVSVLIGLPVVYFLMVVLPNIAPPAAVIPAIAKVQSPRIFLHPIIAPPNKGKSSGKGVLVQFEEDEYEEGDEEFGNKMLVTSELSETEESDDSDGLEIYGDSPFKKIPNFADWKKLYKKSKLYQDHIKMFNAIEGIAEKSALQF
ncbi:unnamed protein product [Ambrosiozyma monospora]|uniref:Unnamed protein product n=1 Tax=Ambrosiozyma monospora TaxID=43982 RepID=A0A9W6Z5G7_AMBMO|nr:unnamed protein product [Ambrosiozyma monospora]